MATRYHYFGESLASRDTNITLPKLSVSSKKGCFQKKQTKPLTSLSSLQDIYENIS